MKLKYIQEVKQKIKGKTYLNYYFRKGNLRKKLPHKNSPKFLIQYAQYCSDYKSVEPIKKKISLGEMFVRYLTSENYLSKSERTKKDYRTPIDYIRERLGHRPIDSISRGEIYDLMEENIEKKRFANYIQQMCSLIFNFAIERGELSKNPAYRIKHFKTGDGYQPWEPELIEKFCKLANQETLLAFKLLVNTGQRISDVLDFKWSDLKDGGISLKQNKTGSELWVPLSSEVQKLLKEYPKKGMWILTEPRGTGRLTYNTIADRFLKIRKTIGAENYTIHGLRYNCITELAHLGASNAQIKSISGHKSDAMINKYAAKANQIRMANSVSKLRSKA